MEKPKQPINEEELAKVLETMGLNPEDQVDQEKVEKVLSGAGPVKDEGDDRR